LAAYERPQAGLRPARDNSSSFLLLPC